MPYLQEPDFWLDDIYDMTEQQLQEEVNQYARLARHGPHAEKKSYRFAYHRHFAAKDLLDKIRSTR